MGAISNINDEVSGYRRGSLGCVCIRAVWVAVKGGAVVGTRCVQGSEAGECESERYWYF